jgi:hypothetical protein
MIGGRLKSDYRYSIGLVYNPFPWPDEDDAAREKIGKLAEAVLAARSKVRGFRFLVPDLRAAPFCATL